MLSTLRKRPLPLLLLGALTFCMLPRLHAQDTASGKDAVNADGVDAKTAKKLKAEDNVELIGKRDVSGGIDFYSLQKEEAMGQQLADELAKDSKVITDPVVNEYLNRIVQNVARNSDAKMPITVHLIQDDTVNAVTLPGGQMFVNSGLILALGEEDELAGVLGHEIAHVACRHGTKNATKGELMQLLAIPAVIVAGPGLAGMGVEEGANVAIPLQFEKFSRGDEQEADWLGTQYLWKAGYDPQGLPRAFEILEGEEKIRPGFVSRLFMNHPETANRLALTEKEIRTIIPARASYIITTSEFQQIQARLRALTKSKIEPGLVIPGGVVAAPPAPPAGPPVIKH